MSSADMSAAMEVWEEIGFLVVSGPNDAGEFSIWEQDQYPESSDPIVVAPTLPLAICMAASALNSQSRTRAPMRDAMNDGTSGIQSSV